ncbi:uncharacterized protein BCR38DRAFT_465299 [Pseudomassariella vexata]|uniref:Uncharacterized protein n=1 Tax=Pseudomassariella vexata TaxID=1141098 RepID=A0A1Y2E4B9_9PEZI|nr:uncharacterized protein BCR38DRAFT_465299 [Pseudomassariella vexata]ORY66401.1 hypothetical protein BCR38DRAFT_465299 [Pseudomassariella vexata]
MAKLTKKQLYPNAAPKTSKYGSIFVISSTNGGTWGPCFTMTSHAALGAVTAGVNRISVGQIGIGVSFEVFDVKGMTSQFPPSALRKPQTKQNNIGLERAGNTQEVAIVTGFLASEFSSQVQIW